MFSYKLFKKGLYGPESFLELEESFTTLNFSDGLILGVNSKKNFDGRDSTKGYSDLIIWWMLTATS